MIDSGGLTRTLYYSNHVRIIIEIKVECWTGCLGRKAHNCFPRKIARWKFAHSATACAVFFD